MKQSDLLQFAKRDWQALVAAKAAHWSDQKTSHGAAVAVRAAESLRRHVSRLRPGWPTEGDRSEDLAVHVRIAASLARVRTAGSP